MNQYNYYRRASINKFHNRPPFNIKKMDDATCTENKEQNSSFCNNCEKKYLNTAAKSYINVVKYLEHFSSRYENHMNNTNKRIIPKIIENFQKVTPKNPTSKILKYKRKSESLETIFRNNSPIFGKTLPNHRLMKDLLKNFDKAHGDTPCQQIDMVPSKDIPLSIHPSEVPTSITDSYIKVRIDKKTSTTGLEWPVSLNEEHVKENLVNSKKFIKNPTAMKLKSKIPQRKHNSVVYANHSCKCINPNQLNRSIDCKHSTDSSDLEYFPTKENPFKNDITSKVPKGPLQMESINKGITDKAVTKHRRNINQEGYKKENTYIIQTDKPKNSESKSKHRMKEKSFVQLQVEKLNKRNNSRNARLRERSSNICKETKDVDCCKRNMNKHYISLITHVKDTLPKIEEKLLSDSVSENHDWSDKQINIDTQVQFPKETRNAVEHQMKNLKRIPLTKCTKDQNFQIQPAISVHCRTKTECEDCNRTYSGLSQKKISLLPCPKNLLCQRGHHDGPCTRSDTASSVRYGDSLLLSTPKVLAR